jgi:energy-converting hydrogenase Eha subunit G
MLSEERLVSERAHGRMMELEGECKIERYTFMRLNLLKAIPLTILLTLSLFGLFALKYSAKLRKKVFYTDCEA